MVKYKLMFLQPGMNLSFLAPQSIQHRAYCSFSHSSLIRGLNVSDSAGASSKPQNPLEAQSQLWKILPTKF